MLGPTWKALPRVRTGDWRSKLVAVAQIAVGVAAALGLLGMVTREPLLLLAFTAVQWLLVVGVGLFAIVALLAQRTLILEEYEPDQVIFREGDEGRDVYVIRSGQVDVIVRRPGGGEEVLKRLGPGDPFGEMALLRKAPRNATIRTLTAVEVFRMSPTNFAALYTNLPGLRDHFNTIMEARLRELKTRK